MKMNSEGWISKYKGKFLASCFSQAPGLDYNEKRAATARLSKIQTMLTFGVQQGIKFGQLCIKAANLNSPIDEEIHLGSSRSVWKWLTRCVRPAQTLTVCTETVGAQLVVWASCWRIWASLLRCCKLDFVPKAFKQADLFSKGLGKTKWSSIFENYQPSGGVRMRTDSRWLIFLNFKTCQLPFMSLRSVISWISLFGSRQLGENTKNCI